MSAYSDAVLATPNLASYWRLDESSGTTVNAAFGAVTGSYTGAGVTYSQPSLLAGDPAATSVLFDDAIPADARFGDVYGFEPTSPFSAEVWVRPFVADVDGTIWYKTAGGVGGWRMDTAFPNLNAFRTDSAGASDSANYSGGMGPGTNYHLVMTYDGALLTLYVNGTLTQQVASTRNIGDNTTQLFLGSAAGGSGFKGWFQEAAIYTAGLSADTVREHYVLGVAGGIADLAWTVA